MPAPNSADYAADLLAQCCERMGARALLVRTDSHRWHLLLVGSGTFEIEWSDSWGRLMLTASLGWPPAGGERTALNLALSYNALWRQVGSLRMARKGPAGELLLIGDLGLGDMEPPAFETVLAHFDGLRCWWSGALAQASEGVLASSVPHGRIADCI